MPSTVKALSGIVGQCIDTVENWELQNPVVPNGLLCIEKSGTTGDVIKVKIGDGVKTYNQLDYFPEAASTIPLASETEYGIVKKGTISEMIAGEENTKYTTALIHETYHTQEGKRTIPAITPEDNGHVFKAGAEPGSGHWGIITPEEIGAATEDHIHDVVTDTTDGFMSKEEHLKLTDIEDHANLYIHPASHPAAIITEDADHRFVTDTEKSAWNGKQDPGITLADYGITDATPSSHIGSNGNSHAVVTDLANGFMSKEEHVKLANIQENATNYEHPLTHNATMIVEDSTHRFTTDAEKTAWNNKQNPATTLAGYGITDAAPLSHVGSNGTSHGVVTDTENGFMSKEEHVKLSEIEDGANLYVHPSTHTAAEIVEDSTRRFVSDTEKNIWNGKQNALGFTPENVATKNAANGYAGLDSNGKLYENQLPSIAIIDVFEAASEAEMLALYLSDRGDVCIRSDINKTFILAADDYTQIGNWKELRTPTDHVLSVAGKTGVVVLTKADVGLSNVDDTADNVKNVLSATKLATAQSITLSGDATGSAQFDGTSVADITVTVVDDSHNHIIANVDNLQTELDNRAPISHVGSTGTAHGVVTDLVNGFMSKEEHTKLSNIADGANLYVHPVSHPATMITEDGTHRFVTDLEKEDWNQKQDPGTTLAEYGITDAAPLGHVGAGGNAHSIANTFANGFMSTDHVNKLNGIADNANNYSHPNHSGDVTSVADGATTINNNVVGNSKLADVATQTLKGRATAGTGDPEDLTPTQVRTILNVEDGANAYVHPSSHPATMITEDSTHRFTTDAEKTEWNGKPNLGELATDAYRGDRGKIAYDHSLAAHAPSNAQKNSDILKSEIEAKLTGVITSHDHSSISGNAATATKLATAVTINGVSFDGSANITVADSTKQPLDADLTAIAALAGTSGLLKKTAANTWALDTTVYSVDGHGHVATAITEDATHRFVTDVEKNTWNGKQNALGFTPENSANKNVANGYAGLGADGKIIESLLPSIALVNTFEAASEAAMLALSGAEQGDICIRSDINKTFILSVNGYSTLANWKELRTPTDTVLSVAGKTGVVTLTKSDVGLANVDNTSDLNKPISTATQTALNGKVATTRTVNSKPLSADVVLTTTDIADATDKRYVTDAQRTVLTNTSGVNTGDETATTLGTKINGSTEKTTPVDADLMPIADSAASFIMKKLTFANLKATLKTYFDTLYNKYVHPNHSGDVTSIADGATTIAANAVGNTKLADMATATIKGRVTAGAGDPEDLTAAQVRTLLNVADGANNYTHPASHPPSIITQDASNRFVSDTEKSTWNAKSDLALGTTSTTAMRGDYGTTAYNHSLAAHAPSDAQKNSDILKSEIEAKLTGLITTHNHNLADMGEKSYISLTDKPNIEDIVRRSINYVNTTGATYLKFAETIVDPDDYFAVFKLTIKSSVDATIYHTMLCVVSGHKNTIPQWTIDTKTNNSTLATTGLQILRGIYPKTVGNGYKTELELYFNNTTQREITLEIIEAKNITFLPSLGTSAYNSTYHNATSSNVYYNGIVTNGTIYGAFSGNVSGNATSANYLLSNTYTAGEALAANDLIFLQTDNKWYKALTASAQLPLGALLARCNAAVAAAANVTAYIQGMFSLPTGVTGVLGKDLFIRGQITGGVFVSDGTVVTSVAAGYSYMRFGSCFGTTSLVNYDGNNRIYTLDADGNLSALDNIPTQLTAAQLMSLIQTVDGIGSGLDADLLDGLQQSAAATGSTVAARDSNGDITMRLPRTNYADQATISGGMVFRVNNSTDNFLRVCNDIAAIRAFLDVPNTAHTHAGQGFTPTIDSTTDLNTLLTAGIYAAGGNANAPTANDGLLMVLGPKSDKYIQVWYNTPSGGDSIIYTRQRKTDLSWTAWTRDFNSGTLGQINSTHLQSAVSLIIYDQNGSAVKTLYGAGA